MQATETATQFALITPGDMEPYPALNPRTHFDDDELVKLARSIKSQGVRQALAVHDRGEGLSPRYWVVAGERRWRCATGLQLPGVPCTIGIYTEAEAFEVALTENLQRAQLRPMEEARAFVRWFELNPGKTQEQFAERIGMSQPYIANRIRLLDLPEPIQRLVDGGILQASYARDMLLSWTREEPGLSGRFFNILAQHIEFRTDYHEPIAKAWLAGVVGQIGMVVRPGTAPATNGTPEPAAAPTTPSKPASAVAAPPPKAESPAPAPVSPSPAVEPSEPSGPVAEAAGYEIVDERPEEERAPAAGQEEPAFEPIAPASIGVIATMAPATASYNFGLSVFRDQGTGPVIVTVSARSTTGGTSPSPLLVKDSEDKIEAALAEALRPYIANLTAA